MSSLPEQLRIDAHSVEMAGSADPEILREAADRIEELEATCLDRHEPTGHITFRGTPISEFNAEELRNIVEIAMDQCAAQVKFYKTAIDGFRALARPKGEPE